MKRFLPLLIAFLLAATSLPAASIRVYLGTLTSGSSRGIYLSNLDLDDGALSTPVLAAETKGPSWLALDPSRRHLYTGDNASGTVSAFAVDPGSGRLSFINRQSAGGKKSSIPHLAVDATGRMLVVADYGGAAVYAFPIRSDGSLGPRSAEMKPSGPLGPNKKRQDHPRPHSVTLSPDGKFAFACDLGLDRVLIYRLDPDTAGLAPNQPAFAAVPPGAGPRHSAFSPDERFYYVVTEMGNSICVFAYDSDRGALALHQTVSTLPPDSRGASFAAEVAVHPNGKFLYVCNRGKQSDNLAVFSRDREEGTLNLIQTLPCGGDYPRNFSITPDGRWLLCANQNGDNVVVFRVDPETGRLTATGHEVPLSRAMCVLFYQ